MTFGVLEYSEIQGKSYTHTLKVSPGITSSRRQCHNLLKAYISASQLKTHLI